MTDGAESDAANVKVDVAAPNTPPTASAGPDQFDVAIGAAVVLDGRQSTDPDGHVLTYSWSVIARPPDSLAVLAEPKSATPSFSPDVQGDYVAQLIVNDGFVDSAPDSVLIRTASTPPGDMAVTSGTLSVDDAIVATLTICSRRREEVCRSTYRAAPRLSRVSNLRSRYRPASGKGALRSTASRPAVRRSPRYRQACRLRSRPSRSWRATSRFFVS